jgi:hypothetical protein
MKTFDVYLKGPGINSPSGSRWILSMSKMQDRLSCQELDIQSRGPGIFWLACIFGRTGSWSRTPTLGVKDRERFLGRCGGSSRRGGGSLQ